MENSKDQKTYTAEDVLAARLRGRNEAEEFLQERIAQILITNHKLLIEILRLDAAQPVTGVMLPYTYAWKLHRKLQKNKLLGYARRLKSYIENSNPIAIEHGEELELLKNLEVLLNELGKKDVPERYE